MSDDTKWLNKTIVHDDGSEWLDELIVEFEDAVDDDFNKRIQGNRIDYRSKFKAAIQSHILSHYIPKEQVEKIIGGDDEASLREISREVDMDRAILIHDNNRQRNELRAEQRAALHKGEKQ